MVAVQTCEVAEGLAQLEEGFLILCCNRPLNICYLLRLSTIVQCKTIIRQSS